MREKYFMKVPKNSIESQRIPRNPEESLMNEEYVRFPRIPKKSSRILKNPQESSRILKEYIRRCSSGKESWTRLPRISKNPPRIFHQSAWNPGILGCFNNPSIDSSLFPSPSPTEIRGSPKSYDVTETESTAQTL